MFRSTVDCAHHRRPDVSNVGRGMGRVPPCSEDVVPLLQVTQSRRSYKGGADTTPCIPREMDL